MVLRQRLTVHMHLQRDLLLPFQDPRPAHSQILNRLRRLLETPLHHARCTIPVLRRPPAHRDLPRSTCRLQHLLHQGLRPSTRGPMEHHQARMYHCRGRTIRIQLGHPTIMRTTIPTAIVSTHTRVRRIAPRRPQLLQQARSGLHLQLILTKCRKHLRIDITTVNGLIP
jgi:hypothetical protein